jgi:hypothetical protein
MLFLACFIFKILATLDFKVKYLRFRAHKLISPSFLAILEPANGRLGERDSSGTSHESP